MNQAERDGIPFLLYRDGAGEHQLRPIPPEVRVLGIGRNPAADVCIGWDGEVSGLHAQIENAGGEFTLVDDGMSRNGSYVNGERLRGRRRLHNGDMLRFGKTVVQFRRPTGTVVESTLPTTDALTAQNLSEQQRKVLIALCRPFKDDDPMAVPTSNQAIADELVVSVEAVKLHLRALFEKFGVSDLPQNTKRVALVRHALQSGLISGRELSPPLRSGRSSSAMASSVDAKCPALRPPPITYTERPSPATTLPCTPNGIGASDVHLRERKLYETTVSRAPVGVSPPAAMRLPPTTVAPNPPRGVGIEGMVCHRSATGSYRSTFAEFSDDDSSRPPTA